MAMQGCVRLCEAMHGCVLAVQGYAWLCMGGLGLMGVVWPLLLSIRVAPIIQFLIYPYFVLSYCGGFMETLLKT